MTSQNIGRNTVRSTGPAEDVLSTEGLQGKNSIIISINGTVGN